MASRGERLIEAMNRRGMQKQYALAYTLGVNESTVTRWKNDGPMSLDHAIALCRTLDMSLDWFLNGAGSMDQHAPRDAAEDEHLSIAFRRVAETLSGRSKSHLTAFLQSIEPR